MPQTLLQPRNVVDISWGTSQIPTENLQDSISLINKHEELSDSFILYQNGKISIIERQHNAGASTNSVFFYLNMLMKQFHEQPGY